MLQDIIKLLPDNIANQIAAGEVVVRPASVVKELMENSIDAGATLIHLVIKDAGRTLIQVIDDGKGMSETDARMSFERHATSKIDNADDLYALHTMGFRGEALASIAAVAQVELKTKTEGAELGTHISVEANEVKKQEPVSCPKGANFIVKNLFYNVPARRNFLKSNTVEMRHIVDEFVHVAMAFPDIAFTLHNNDIEMYRLKAGSLKQRIVSIMGNPIQEMLLPIEEDTSIVKIHGFITKPESAKKTRGDQYFFVNKRYIKSPYLHHAVNMAYADMMTNEHYAGYIVFLDIDPSKIDVNVHPTKNEIKFEDERHIYTILNASVRKALGQFTMSPLIDFQQEHSILGSIGGASQQQSFDKYTSGSMRPEKSYFEKNNIAHWESLYDGLQQSETISMPSKMDSGIWTESDIDRLESEPYQLHAQYIFSPISSGYIVIDQEAAHQRILFERFLYQIEQGQRITQQLLFPKTITISSQDAIILEELLPDLKSMGFEIENFGKDTFIVHGLPSELNNVNEKELIETFIEQFQNQQPQLKHPKQEILARSMSLHSGIKKGKTLSKEEIKHLIDELFACKVPDRSPFGSRTYIKQSIEDLHSLFK